VISGYVPNTIRYARLVLEDACIGVSQCRGSAESPLSCSRGECADPHVDARNFSADRNAPSLIAQGSPASTARDGGGPDAANGTSGDGGPDASGDGGPGARSDGGPDAANDAGPVQGTCKLGSSRLPCRLGN
jgi:hypothetical protein